MSVDVLTEREIQRPREEVASFATDPANATRWYANIHGVEWVSEPPLTLGSRFRFRARFLARDLEYTYEVVEHRPLQRLVMRTSDGPFPMETTYEWSDTPSGTLMRLRNRGEPEGYFRMLGGPIAFAMRRANRADLERLQGVVER